MINNDEKILWEGKPKTGLFFWNKYILYYLIISFLYLTALIVIFVWTMFYLENVPFDSNVGLIIASVFVLGLPLRFLLNNFRRQNTFYVLTEKRIFIQYIWFRTKIKSYELKNIQQMSLRKFNQEYGTILINYEQHWFNKVITIRIETRCMKQSKRLEYISDVKSVLQIINNQK